MHTHTHIHAHTHTTPTLVPHPPRPLSSLPLPPCSPCSPGSRRCLGGGPGLSPALQALLAMLTPRCLSCTWRLWPSCLIPTGYPGLCHPLPCPPLLIHSPALSERQEEGATEGATWAAVLCVISQALCGRPWESACDGQGQPVHAPPCSPTPSPGLGMLGRWVVGWPLC